MNTDNQPVDLDKWKEDNIDKQLDKCIRDLASGDKSAMRDLYNYSASSVYGFAMSILKNPQDCEDVLHDCFIRIYQSAASYTSYGKPMAWIFTITRNLCMQKLREQSRISDIAQEDWEQYMGENDNISSEDNMILSECLNTLSEEERRIVVMHAVSGMKHKEIAAFLNMPLSTVLSKYNRSLKKLKTILTKGDSYEE